MVLTNSPGTVDFGYRGEVFVVFEHTNTSFEPYKIGDRIAQIKVGIAPKIEFVESEELTSTERGSGAYGSTGK